MSNLLSEYSKFLQYRQPVRPVCVQYSIFYFHSNLISSFRQCEGGEQSLGGNPGSRVPFSITLRSSNWGTYSAAYGSVILYSGYIHRCHGGCMYGAPAVLRCSCLPICYIRKRRVPNPDTGQARPLPITPLDWSSFRGTRLVCRLKYSKK